MKQLILLFLPIFVFTGCHAILEPKNDILEDSAHKEKVYTAIKNYDDLIKINKDKLQKNDNAKNRLALVGNYYDMGDFDSAMYYLKPLLNEGKNYQAFLFKAKIEESKNNHNNAINDALTSIKLNAKNPEAYNVIGIIKTKQKKFDEAKAAFLKSKELFLDDYVINNNLAMLEIARLNYEAAISYLLPLYNRNYKEPKIISNLIFALAKLNRDDEALEIIKKEGLAKNPSNFLKNIKTVAISK